jgi:1-deoxy-D-xylulose-5-phosphate reductoisomerase
MADASTASKARRQVAILGSTGSVGSNTLDVIARHPERYEVVGLSAHQRIDALAAQCLRFAPRVAVVPTDAAASSLRQLLAGKGLRTQVQVGANALTEMTQRDDVDTVMAAIVGAAGLGPCMAAARAGKRLLLANKEALVLGGALFMQAVAEGGAELLPIDSEHSAIFQCLPVDRSRWAATIEHIVLTASGGPFRLRELSTLAAVTPEQACAHPNWVMGQKISVDSATMMNKALEVIEARWLFDLQPQDIQVWIHPQSIVHSMVGCRDGSMLAQLGTPDMRVPIAYGLSFPERVESGATRLDLKSMAGLNFEALDARRFPGLQLAYDALQAPLGATAVLNAANEEAVAAFLARRLRFTDIHTVNQRALSSLGVSPGVVSSIDDLLALDERCRAFARQDIMELATQ